MVQTMFRDILDRLFQTNQKTSQPDVKPISQLEIEALVDARVKEHAATFEKNIVEQVKNGQPEDQEDYSLTTKQIDFAFSLIEKTKEFELAADPGNLTVKDLNKLIAYNRYKNKGILINLLKKGILKRKQN